MRRCLQLAEQGDGSVAPNPMVGCVIVQDDKIIGEGFHKSFGKAHAEVNAIGHVEDKELLKSSTLYVNLEPCAHYGKTPPCADLIIRSGIPRVVVGCEDPFDAVAGKGIAKLKENGVEVILDVLKEECRFLNRRFFTFHEKKRPYLILKWAQTSDGFIDKIRTGEMGVNWITGKEVKQLVHLWRSHEQAILVGTNTVLNDDPSLTVREVSGRNPIRIIIDRQLKTHMDAKVYDLSARTIVMNEVRDEIVSENLQLIKLNDHQDFLPQVLSTLYDLNILSVMIEGGAFTLQSFIDIGMWDEARMFCGDKTFGEGLKAPDLHRATPRGEKIGKDSLSVIFNNP